MKRIIQFFLLLGFFVYGRQALAQTPAKQNYEVITVKPNDTVSKIALEKTRRGSNWNEPWILVVDTKGLVRQNKDLIHPGWEVWIKKDEIKTSPVQLSNHSLESVCLQYANPNCEKSLSGINQIKNTTAPLTRTIHVPNEFVAVPPAGALHPNVTMMDIPQTRNTVLWLVGILATAIIAVVVLILTKGRLKALPRIAIPMPRLVFPRFAAIPIPLQKRKEKLALIRRDIIYRAVQRGQPFRFGCLKIEPFRAKIIYDSGQTNLEIHRLFSEMETIYREAKAKTSSSSSVDGFNHHTIAEIRFPRLNNIGLARLREIGAVWIQPEMIDFTKLVAEKFNEPQSTDRNRQPFHFKPDPDPAAGLLRIEITSQRRKDLSAIPDTEAYLDRILRNIGDPRFKKISFEIRDGKGMITLNFKPNMIKEKPNEIADLRLRYG